MLSVYPASSVFPSLPSLSAVTGMTAAYGGGEAPGSGPEADHAHSHTHEGGHSPGQWYGGYHDSHYNR